MPLKPIFFLLALATAIGSHAQNSDDYLRQSLQDGYTLYFIHPAEFKAMKGKARMETDFTFTYSQAIPEKADMRFSLFTKAPIRTVDSLAFYQEGARIGGTEKVESMFLEKSRGKWHGRYETALPYSTLFSMLEAGASLRIKAYYGEKSWAFPAGKDWCEASEVVVEILAVEIK